MAILESFEAPHYSSNRHFNFLSPYIEVSHPFDCIYTSTEDPVTDVDATRFFAEGQARQVNSLTEYLYLYKS